jgi:nucleoside phosphorylase
MKIKKGVICTGNSFDISPIDKEIILKNKCAAIEMEAGSVAWVSILRNIPMLAIKGVGNIADSKTSRAEYIDNGPNIRDRLADTTEDFIKNLPNNSISHS